MIGSGRAPYNIPLCSLYARFNVFNENASFTMKRLLSIVLPVVVIVAALASARVIKANKPEPFSRPPEKSALLVEAVSYTHLTLPTILLV